MLNRLSSQYHLPESHETAPALQSKGFSTPQLQWGKPQRVVHATNAWENSLNPPIIHTTQHRALVQLLAVQNPFHSCLGLFPCVCLYLCLSVCLQGPPWWLLFPLFPCSAALALREARMLPGSQLQPAKAVSQEGL